MSLKKRGSVTINCTNVWFLKPAHGAPDMIGVYKWHIGWSSIRCSHGIAFKDRLMIAYLRGHHWSCGRPVHGWPESAGEKQATWLPSVVTHQPLGGLLAIDPEEAIQKNGEGKLQLFLKHNKHKYLWEPSRIHSLFFWLLKHGFPASRTWGETPSATLVNLWRGLFFKWGASKYSFAHWSRREGWSLNIIKSCPVWLQLWYLQDNTEHFCLPTNTHKGGWKGNKLQ